MILYFDSTAVLVTVTATTQSGKAAGDNFCTIQEYWYSWNPWTTYVQPDNITMCTSYNVWSHLRLIVVFGLSCEYTSCQVKHIPLLAMALVLVVQQFLSLSLPLLKVVKLLETTFAPYRSTGTLGTLGQPMSNQII